MRVYGRKGIRFDLIGMWVGVMILSVLSSCQPEMPVTSSISIEVDGLAVPVEPNLYGLTIEEINHGIDGGLYAELIRNRSFEEGIPPLNCPYDPVRNVLITPNGWTIPFVRPDSIPGWRPINLATARLYPDTKELINDKNRRSLLVSVSASPEAGRGGVIAEGYRGIALKKGERYDLSFFAKGVNVSPRTVRVALEDSAASCTLSDVFSVSPSYEWKHYRHTFTATEDVPNAVLTFASDSSAMFWLDVVSLFPQRTWKGEANGLRPDLAALVDSLAPRFIRFPGGSFVEGYTAGTFPVWRETIGDISERRHFWNVWAYGSTNGMGYHEFLRLCEDLGAEPVYVVNSGITSQSRRPRYEDITAMDRLVNDALDAIAYANAPVDSAMGALRADHGHPGSFGLKYIEIGSENYGPEYARRFVLFREAIKKRYPEVTVIAGGGEARRNQGEWSDDHYYAGSDFFMSNTGRFTSWHYPRRSPALLIGEFGTTELPWAGTLGAAVAEACFLIGAEESPEIVRRLAYASVLGNAGFPYQRHPLIAFNTERAVVSPSYHVLRMFAHHRGDQLLRTDVDTYKRPQVGTGRAGIELFDNSYEFRQVRIDNVPVKDFSIVSGGWNLPEPGRLVPDANRWNRVLFGDSTRYTCDYTATIRRVKGSGQIQLRLCDNGLSGERSDYISLTIGSGTCELYHQAGGVRDQLAAPVPFPFESNRWYNVRLTCEHEHIRCFVDDTLLYEVDMNPIPSLVSVATLDKERNMLYLKVVNTTYHEERTALRIEGAHVRSEGEVLQLSGEPEARNTFEDPEAVTPVRKPVSFPSTGSWVYRFPPNSVSILLLHLE